MENGFVSGNSRTPNGTLASVLDESPEVEMQTDGAAGAPTKLAEDLHLEQELRARAEADCEDKGRRLAVRTLRPPSTRAPPVQQYSIEGGGETVRGRGWGAEPPGTQQHIDGGVGPLWRQRHPPASA
jgi:hypothetical protein